MTAQNEVDKNAMGGTELLGKLLEENIDPALLAKFQIIRSRVREFEPNKIPILWLHDLPNDPESHHLKDPSSRERFAAFVFVSHWQQEQYNLFLGVPYSRGIVIPNAIEPFEESVLVKPEGPTRLIYTPTPHRGLNILVPVFEELVEEGHDIVLDVFSSFKLYGWEQRDAEYRELFDRCRRHPRINYHGTQPNSVVRDALRQAHIFAYPSIWPETSCLCAIEAMSAGCFVVCPHYAALTETVGGLGFQYGWTENIEHHKLVFKHRLKEAIVSRQVAGTHFAKTYIDAFHNKDGFLSQWKTLLMTLTRIKQ